MVRLLQLNQDFNCFGLFILFRIDKCVSVHEFLGSIFVFLISLIAWRLWVVEKLQTCKREELVGVLRSVET